LQLERWGSNCICELLHIPQALKFIVITIAFACACFVDVTRRGCSCSRTQFAPTLHSIVQCTVYVDLRRCFDFIAYLISSQVHQSARAGRSRCNCSPFIAKLQNPDLCTARAPALPLFAVGISFIMCAPSTPLLLSFPGTLLRQIRGETVHASLFLCTCGFIFQF
jgi:hypothetical protein